MNPPMSRGWRRWGLLAAGHLSFGLAIAGVFLPLLPTTPFLLLASFCYLRSSNSAYQRLQNHPLTSGFLRDWQAHRAVKRSVKRTALLTVLALLAGSIWLSRNSWPAQLGCVLGSTIGLIVLIRLPVIPDNSLPRLISPDQDGPAAKAAVSGKLQ